MARPSKGVSLNDTNLSSQAEPQLFESLIEDAHTLGSDNENPKSEYVIFKLVSNARKGRVNIDGQDDVINPATGKVERVRLITGATSIWAKDQKDLSEDYVKRNKRSLVFEDRVCRFPKWDEQGIEFARVSRHLIDNPHKKTGSKHEFFEWNPQKQAEESMKKELLAIDAMQKCFELDVPRMTKIALFEGVQFFDELGERKSDTQIRRDLALKVKQNPERFLAIVDDPSVEISYLVAKAIKDGKLEVGREAGKIYYSNGGFIMSYPTNTNAKNALVSFATSKTKEANEFLDNLKELTK